MALPDSSTQATVTAVAARNFAFNYKPDKKEAIVCIVGTGDPSITTIVPEVPLEVISAADVGQQTGFGFMLHRLAIQAFKGMNGVGRVFILPQDEVAGDATIKQIAWVGAATTASGYIYLRLGGKLYKIFVPSGTALTDYSDLVVAAVNADPDAPVIASKTAGTFETVFTSKSKGPWGDLLTVTLNKAQGEALPAGITSGTISTTTPGTGVPDIADALDGLGTEDDANSIWMTHLIHGYNLDTDTIDAVAAYLGLGNEFQGCYLPTVNRPFRCLNGDATAGSAGYTALLAIVAARTDDRANGYLPVPDSATHPDEIAALAIGIIAETFQSIPIKHYAGKTLGGVDPGDSTDRWTKNLSQRDTAVKNGISVTRIIDDKVKLQNVVTGYSYGVSAASNIYKSFRSFAIECNVTKAIRDYFQQDSWQGNAIVANVEDVTDFQAIQVVRDIQSVKTALNNLTDYFVSQGYIYDGEFSKSQSTVTLRTLSNGFDVDYKCKFSGELQVMNIVESFDTNIAA